MIELDIVERLRGKVRVPVNDGAGLLNGQDFFERSFPTSKAAMEAADEIESLRAQLTTSQELCTKFEAAVGEDVAEMLTLLIQLASARKALEFYANEWRLNGDGDSETPGLSRSWMEPTDKLHDDEGRLARETVAALKDTPNV